MEGSVSEYAKEHDYRLIGVPQVILQPDKGVRQGGLRVESAMVPESVEQTVPLGEYPVLVVVEGEGKGRHYPLSFLPEKIREPGKIKVGRRPEANDILLSKQDLHASREHAWIEYDEEQGCYRLHDTSTAGTQVNSDVIKRGATVLHHGDRIRCSETVFQLALPTLTGQERTLDV
jgi:hypothetical protein